MPETALHLTAPFGKLGGFLAAEVSARRPHSKPSVTSSV
jgi:hypothetical protein